jgi:hypothetical protein
LFCPYRREFPAAMSTQPIFKFSAADGMLHHLA